MKPTSGIDIQTICQLQASDLAYLAAWSDRQWELEQFQEFATWLRNWATVELGERQSARYEPGMLELPKSWSGQGWSDALCGSFVLTRHPSTVAVANFADALHMRILCGAGAVLSELSFVIEGTDDYE